MIENRNKFAEMLMSTTVPSVLPYDKQIELFNNVQQSAIEIMPKSLYRYRRCDELNISAFYRDELWVSTADCMNDGFDSRIYYDPNVIDDWISEIPHKKLSKEDFLSIIEKIPNMPVEMSEMGQWLLSMSEDKFDQICSFINSIVTKDMTPLKQLVCSIAQQTVKFCCFSESIVSPYMWGQYSCDETGFALEYDFSTTPFANSPNSFSRECFIYPVIYSNSRFKVPADYVEYLYMYRLMNRYLVKAGANINYPGFNTQALLSVVCPDITIATKIALHKSNEWEKEKEWRLFCSSINDNEFNGSKHGCCIKRPISVYIGRRISEINEKIIRLIAKEKNIPVYKMSLDDKSSAYDLIISRLPMYRFKSQGLF